MAAVALWSCKNESPYIEIVRPEDQMHLQAPTDTVQLNARTKDSVAVTFKWQWPELVYGASSYDYAFKLDVADNQFATSIPKMAISGDNSLSLTHKQLNDWLEGWGVKAGQPISLEAELIATPRGTETYVKPMLSTARLTVIGYASRLFITGTATSMGEDYTFAQIMDKAPGSEVYTWRGTLGEGEVSFISEQSASAVRYGTFTIPRAGHYSLSYDMEANELSWYEPLFLIGSATEGGWNLGATTALSVDGYPELKWTGVLTEGEFKLACHPESGLFEDAFYQAESEHSPAEGTQKIVFNADGSGDDNKWDVTEAGIYTIVVNMRDLSIRFDRDHSMDDLPVKAVWLCGSATPGGWNTPFPEKMSYDFAAALGTFTWTGTLTAGEIKFPCNSSSYEGAFFLADNFDMAVTADQTYRINYFADCQGVDDKKWIIETPGSYKIILNVVENTVKFMKQ